MLKKMVVGEAVFPHMGNINALPEGAGVFAAFDLKEQFREAPSPTGSVALPLPQFGLDRFPK